MWTVEQCKNVQAAGFDSMLGLAKHAFDGFEKVVALNLQTTKTNLALTREGVLKVLSAQSPQELAELQMQWLQPVTDNASSYRSQLQEILAATREEFTKVAEAQYAASRSQLQEFFEGAVSNAPSGSTSPLGAWQEAFKATTILFESMQSTAKQAVEVAEGSFNTAAEAASKGVRRREAQPTHVAAK
ncbi:phasin family protein (plasmid) [Cupriavidus pinatubonensis]|uniref:phasin family protein n=1 Tax=Cupriavidus pinatubonensis TaxID=248026 RepID=UPI001C72CCAA|nr:phasin family protein [Cupriavidus pinatubonensis]QYY34161.1 phasin family protein [Cupriavidus pinatubonensis]